MIDSGMAMAMPKLTQNNYGQPDSNAGVVEAERLATLALEKQAELATEAKGSAMLDALKKRMDIDK